MKLFSIFRKDKPAADAGNGEFYSRAEEEPAPRAKRGAKAARREPADPALPEKKRARRRLVGAVALVLAMAIGLPMILDSEPKPLASDISIQIPSKGKSAPADPAPSEPAPPARSATPQPVAPAAPPSAPASLDAAEEIVETPAPKQAQSTPPARPPAEQLAHPAPPPEAKKPEVKKPEPKKAEIKDKPAARSDDEARALAILEGKPVPPAPKTAEAKSGKFVLQVAALASADKVSEVRGKLSEAGITSYTQKVATASGERIRIRIGPFASRDDAEKMRVRLGKLGFNGTLVPA